MALLIPTKALQFGLENKNNQKKRECESSNATDEIVYELSHYKNNYYTNSVLYLYQLKCFKVVLL